ncbi:hypothetical protein Btru_019448, partial [Bulinus truncatus]
MSSDPNLEKAIRDATNSCTTNQSMIDFTSQHLQELRTQCASTDKITQKEIKDAESKIIRMVGTQLVAKEKLKLLNVSSDTLKEYPKLELWLKIVGIPNYAIKSILEEGLSFTDLMNRDENKLTELLNKFDCSEPEIKTLITAFKNLHSFTELLSMGKPTTDMEWHFTDLTFLQASFGTSSTCSAMNSPATGNSPKHQQRTTSSTASDSYHSRNEQNLHMGARKKPPPLPDMHPPRSTPSSPIPSPQNYNASPPSHRSKSVSSPAVKYPITPPPLKSHYLYPETSLFNNPLSKSKSHESQLANRVVDIDPVKNKKNKPHNIKLSGSHEALFRRRLSTDGSEAGSYLHSGHTSPVNSSPIRSPPYKHDPSTVISEDHNKYSNTLVVPKSPKTPAKIYHQITHRFANTFKITTCDYCHKQMILGYKCKSCKKKFHKDCAQRAPATCGLSDAAVDALLEWQDSPMSHRHLYKPGLYANHLTDYDTLKPVASMPSIPGAPLPDSGSNTSSCNSSSPSSPANHQTSSDTITSPSPGPSSYNPVQFNFPDVSATLPADYGLTVGNDSPERDVVSSNTSNDSDKTLID